MNRSTATADDERVKTGRRSFILSPPLHLLDLLLALAAGAVYLLSLSPGLLPADAGEFQLVGATLDVAHPPGYALYTLLAWLISRTPFVSPAAAVNALSAIMAAATVALVSRSVRRMTGSALAGLLAALLLAFSTTFWAQATTANVRMFTALAAALAVERLVAYRSAPSARRLAWVAFALGLGVSHHGSLVFLAAALGLYALWLAPGRLRRPWPLLAGLIPFLAWLYFPLRALMPGNDPRLATPAGFLEHVLALGFRGDILVFATLEALPERLLILGNILTFQFAWPALLLIGVGAISAIRRARDLGLALLIGLALHGFISVTYRAPQTVEYLLPAYVLMAVLAGHAVPVVMGRRQHEAPSGAKSTPHEMRDGTQSPGSRLARFDHTATGQSAAGTWRRSAALALGMVAVAWQFAATYPSFRALARDDSTRGYAQALLDLAPRDALILAAWHQATPLWYLQRVEAQRPDVEVRYVFPRGEELAQTWVNEITRALPARPVVVTSLYRSEFARLPVRLLPLGPAWRVSAEPLLEPPADLIGARSFGALEFLGFQSLSPVTGAPASEPVVLTAAWRASDVSDFSTFVHLIGPDGMLHGQMDIPHPAAAFVAGEVLLDRYTLHARPDSPPGEYALVAGAYRPDGTRLAETRLATARLEPRQDAPVTTRLLLWPAGGAWLIGRDVDHSLAGQPRLVLHWRLGAGPATTTVLGEPQALPPGPGFQTLAYDLAPEQPLPWPLAPSSAATRYVPLGGALILAGVRLPAEARPGQSISVALDFLAARPIVEDYAFKVEISGLGWRALSEGTPVDGAVPTLKWIAGSRLTDRRSIRVPADAAAGPAQAWLTVYDAFTQAVLPILDPRLARLGQSVPLGEIQVVP